MKNAFAIILIVGVLGGLILWLYVGGDSDTPDDGGIVITENTESLNASTTAYDVRVQPLPTGSAAAEEVARFIAAERALFVADAQSAYDAYLLEQPPYPWRPYSFAIEYERYEVEGYVSYMIDEYTYTGGANGMQVVRTFNYAPDGSRFTLSDAVPSDKRTAFMTAIRAELYEANGIEGPGDLFGDAIAELDFDDLTNFYLSDSEIVVAFSEYDVGPGALGAVRASVPRSEFATI
jgi:hypothetical protein